MAEMTRKAVLDSVAKKLGFGNLRQLQNKLAHSNLYVGAKQAPSPKWFGGIAKYVYAAGENAARESAIRTIVEFYPIDAGLAADKKLLDADKRSVRANKYHHGIRDELQAAGSGVYVFFDNMGKSIYVGKTVDQNLWARMQQTFKKGMDNRLYLVKHPKNNVAYKSNEEKKRKLKKLPTKVKLYEVARYFSAYAVHRDLVDTVEALLIRTSPNDLQNTRMEGM
ncbi:MAG: hypothetical protein MPK09_06455 [Gammaproteobacteria bacterium]|nr:hypothetical protein [Gammaproteobacteria bacterium]